MSQTTATTLTNIINSEVIEASIANYLIDAVVISPLVTYRSLAGRASKVYTFPRWVKDTGSDMTESVALTNTAMTMSESSITVAQVGIAREITDFAAETNMLGPAALFSRVLQDGIALCAEMREDDLAALFASLTGNTIGSTGVDLSLANFIEAIARMRTAKVRGKYVCVLDDQAMYDLMQAVSSATGTVWSNGQAAQDVINSRSDGFVGSVAGVDIWYTNYTDTANGAADVVSGIWADPASNDDQCALGWVELWAPRVRERIDPYLPSTEISVTSAYGVGAKYAAAGCPIITDA